MAPTFNLRSVTLLLSILIALSLCNSAQCACNQSSSTADQEIVVWTVSSPVLDPQKQNITVRLAAPLAEGTYPVVVFQHGTGLFNIWYSTILNYTASEGYIVIAPQMYTTVFPDGLLPTTDATDEIERAAKVFQWVTSSSSSLKLPSGVEMNLSSVAFTGHSRGGKIAAGLAEHLLNTDVALQALVALDPVDGGPYATAPSIPPTSSCATPHSTAIDAPALIYGSGLGSASIFPLAPACVPPLVGFAQYFNCFENRTYELVATEFGHMDLLDDALPGCMAHPLNCAATLLCKGCSKTVSRGDLRSYLGQLLVAFLDSTLKGEPAAFDYLIENWSTAPIALKDVQVYPPSSQAGRGVRLEAK